MCIAGQRVSLTITGPGPSFLSFSSSLCQYRVLAYDQRSRDSLLYRTQMEMAREIEMKTEIEMDTEPEIEMEVEMEMGSENMMETILKLVKFALKS